MQGTLPAKVGRLISHLAMQPRYVPRYVQHNFGKKVTPLQLELPWFSYAAIDFLRDYLKPGMKVCEYGSGGSTLFFSRRVAWVHAIEDSPEWHRMVTQALQEKGVRNVELVLRPFDFRNPAGFETSDYLWAMPDEQFDVIVVDGAEEWSPVRPTCFLHAEGRIKPGGIIVVDDSWRYDAIRRCNKARHFEIFQSVGPCRPGVTSTDVYFY